MNLVLGSRGRLGQALLSSLRHTGAIAPDRAVYAPWTREDSVDGIVAFLADHRITTVYVAAGVTDPRQPADLHEAVNHLVPRQIIAAASRHGSRVVTFGTIMEQVPGLAGTNSYVRSKLRLADHAARAAQSGAPVLHIRLHTLFGGGPPTTFMFLGQLLAALQRRQRFAMSPGHQLREYHHVDDEAGAILRLGASPTVGILDLSHGETLRLRDIALYLFERFNCPQLLDIGALAAPAYDNFDRLFDRPRELVDHSFRDTLPSVYKYVKSWLEP